MISCHGLGVLVVGGVGGGLVADDFLLRTFIGGHLYYAKNDSTPSRRYRVREREREGDSPCCLSRADLVALINQ